MGVWPARIVFFVLRISGFFRHLAFVIRHCRCEEGDGQWVMGNRRWAMDSECRMSNVECRKNDKARMTDGRLACADCILRASDFGLLSSFGIRHSSLSVHARRLAMCA